MAGISAPLPAFAVPLLNQLQGVKGRYPQFEARCPGPGHAHGDRRPSLSVKVTDELIALHCHANCPTEAIVAAVGLEMTDLFADTARSRPQAPAPAPAPMPIPFTPKPRADETLTAVYTYTDHAGNSVAEKGRFELAELTPEGKPRKQFRWRLVGEQRWAGLGGELAMADLALWGWETVAAAHPDTTIYFCEGEKAAQACRAAGLVAVTHAGGSSTNDFGLSLEVLRGRKVALWPDNDASGREYMAKVEARLRGVARSLRVVSVTVPPKGDAVEYFQAGGTVAALETGSRNISGPTVDYLGADTLRVIIPTSDGTITFTFTNMERTSARSLDCDLTVEVAIPGYSTDPYEENVNLLSRTAKTELRRELEAVYDKRLPWAVHINKALSMARKEYAAFDRSVDLADIPDAENGLFFHDPILPDRAPTIFFGDGSSLKSFLSFELAYCIAHGLPFMGSRAPQVPVLIVDYEDEESNFRRRMKRIALGHGRDDFEPRMIRYLPAHGIPLADLADSIRQVIREWGIGFMIVDSIGPACGGKPEDAIVGLAYARTVKKIGVTSLHIAHISKEDVKRGNTTHPFGSIFWHNEARRTWFIAREQEEETDDLDIGMFCRKVNDGPKPKPLAAHVQFEGLYGAVRITRQDISAIPELQTKRSHKAQVMDALAQTPRQTIKELADDTGLAENAIETVVRRNKATFVVTHRSSGKGGRSANEYSLASERSDQEAPSSSSA